MQRSMRTNFVLHGLALTVLALVAGSLVGCAVSPTIPSKPSTHLEMAMPAEKTKAVLEKIQKNHPEYTIRALLKPKENGTEVTLTVYTPQTVHMVVRGFQEPSKGKKVYPDCNHWFDVTRSFDPACGGGPYLGTANLVFGDGMALGLMFDLFQAARYPFTYTQTKMPDQNAMNLVVRSLRAAEKSAAVGQSAAVAIALTSR